MKKAPKGKGDFLRANEPVLPVKPRILVQHNEEAIREIAASMLTSAGYECREAASPTQALEILGSGEEFDLLLCKVMESLKEKLFERMAERFPDIPSVVWGNRPLSLFLEALREGGVRLPSGPT